LLACLSAACLPAIVLRHRFTNHRGVAAQVHTSQPQPQAAAGLVPPLLLLLLVVVAVVVAGRVSTGGLRRNMTSWPRCVQCVDLCMAIVLNCATSCICVLAFLPSVPSTCKKAAL
jgi:hypothetical protein